MILSHKIRLYPTREQEQAFVRACGCSRFTYNWALNEWNNQFFLGGKPNGNELKRYFNSIKKEQFPWIYDSPKDANQKPFLDIQLAFNNFLKNRFNYPKFKKKSDHDSFYMSNTKIKICDKYVYIQKIGKVKLSESLRLNGKIMSYTISRTADKWFIAISVEIGDYNRNRISDNIIGVDLGLKSLAVYSDGTVIDSLKSLKNSIKKLKRFHRQHSRKKNNSNNRKKSVIRLSKLYYRISCKRKDTIHKLTTQLCRENQTIVIENLNIKGMIKNHSLSQSISDASWGEFRRQLEYKSKIYRNSILIANRFYPSSKTCSECGSVKETLLLSERTYICDYCGFGVDRDLNAALNLRTLGLRGTNACGEEDFDVDSVLQDLFETFSMNQEPEICYII